MRRTSEKNSAQLPCLGFSADFRPRSEKNCALLLQKGDTGKTATHFVLWAELAFLEKRQIGSHLWDTDSLCSWKSSNLPQRLPSLFPLAQD